VELARRRSQLPASRRRIVVYSLSLVVLVLVVVVGFHQLERMRWVDAVYFESMLAAGQGPPISLTTDWGKIFASVMGFVSVGTVLVSLVVNIGPIISQVWRESIEQLEADARKLEQDVSGKKKKDEPQAA
jgi:hypothetical protein